ncbi:MAG: P1 family peptidase [Limnochordales bacterium]
MQRDLADANSTITAVQGVRVGHWTEHRALTGCTVVLFDGRAVAAVDVRGGGPGTRETDLLAPGRLVRRIDAVLLTGGSAFGLAAADGVMRWLEERGLGYDTGVARVPIVPAAVVFDLGVGDQHVRPGPDAGYAACEAASAAPVAEGGVGAGTGATVGKWAGPQYAMKGGLGSSALPVPGGGTVGALAVVNAVGDIVDPLDGRLVAGAYDREKQAFLTLKAVRAASPFGGSGKPAPPATNTVIAVVATDVVLSKEALYRVAQMAHDGIARTVYPAHTPWDGDTVFAVSTERVGAPSAPGREEMEQVGVIGALAAEALALAVLRGVRAARDAGGLPAARSLPRG